MIQAVISKIISLQSTYSHRGRKRNRAVCYISRRRSSDQYHHCCHQKNEHLRSHVNRFCKKVGFKGFNSFKVALAQENFRQSDEPAEYGLSRRKFYRHCTPRLPADAEQHLRLLDEQPHFQAAEAIKTAAHIFIFSFSNTALVSGRKRNSS